MTCGVIGILGSHHLFVYISEHLALYIEWCLNHLAIIYLRESAYFSSKRRDLLDQGRETAFLGLAPWKDET